MAKKIDLIESTELKGQINLAGVSISKKNYDKLYEDVRDMLKEGDYHRMQLVDKMNTIDTAYSGTLKLSDEDVKRAMKNKSGNVPLPTEVNLQMMQAQIDGEITYILSTTLPESSMYSAMASKDKQNIAQGVTKLLNESGRKFRHFTGYAKAVSSILRYNIGGVFVQWEEVHGAGLTTDTITGQVVINSDTLIWAGNAVHELDMRNFIYDNSVVADRLAEEGEYAAKIELASAHKINRMIDNNDIVIERISRSNRNTPAGSTPPVSYLDPPELSTAGDPKLANTSATSGYNWVAGGRNKATNMYTLVTMWARLDGSEYGLEPKSTLQTGKLSVYRIRLIGDKIVSVHKQDNAHALIPCVLTRAVLDGLEKETSGYGEQLIPLQMIASQALNTMIKSKRKRLYGLKVYDKTAIDVQDIDKENSENQWIGVNTANGDTDVSNKLKVYNDVPDVGNTFNEVAAIKQLMEEILPTDLKNSMAQLDRATEFQAYATVKSGSQRSLKIARILNDTLFETTRKIMVYNLLQYQQSIEIMTDEGETVNIDPRELRNMNLEIAISDGLKGIDKQLLAGNLYKLLALAFQNTDIAQQYDVGMLLDYYSELLGDKSDLSSFKIKNDFDKLKPEQKQQAYQIYVKLMQQQGGSKQQNGAGPQTMAQGVTMQGTGNGNF